MHDILRLEYKDMKLQIDTLETLYAVQTSRRRQQFVILIKRLRNTTNDFKVTFCLASEHFQTMVTFQNKQKMLCS